MQGSGTFAVEATLGSVIPPNGRILLIDNGAYGQRMAKIAERLRIDSVILTHRETEPVRLDQIRRTLQEEPTITHVAMVHCETTTGMLNPAAEVGRLAEEFGKSYFDKLKARRFMIYPGKVTDAETFRIGNIGHVFPEDIDELIRNVSEVVDEMGIELTPVQTEPGS